MFIDEQLRLFKENPVVNWHEHVWTDADGKMREKEFDAMMEHAELVGMDTMVVSCPIVTNGHESAENMRHHNNIVADAIRRYPGRVRGLAFVDPVHQQKALDEIDRCVNEFGMVGIKMYHQYRMDDPVQFPIIEKCIKLDIPILMHAGKLTYQPESQPRISHGEYFAHVAKRYPEANFIMAHITGGGDWHWQLKGMEKYPNVVLDISGSVIDSPVIEECVARIGADRILYGTDGSTSAGVGKVLAANISEKDKRTILAGTKYRRFLEKE